MKSWSFAAALVAAGGLLIGAAPAPQPSKAACALARQIVAEQVLRHPLPATQVLAARDRRPMHRDPADFGPVKGKPTPPPALLAAYLKRDDTSALACAEVRALLDERGASYGPDAEASAQSLFDAAFKRDDPPVTVHYISLPVMSADGRAAMVSVGSRCKGLCGMAVHLYYRKDKAGRWQGEAVGPLILS